MTSKQLVLGSTSPFRYEVMKKLHIPFTTAAPNIDETPLLNEQPLSMIRRLTRLKAQAVAKTHPNSLIISSDQCSVLEGEIIGKSHHYDNAVRQLRNSSGKKVDFLTGLCVYDSTNDRYELDVIPFSVEFRVLTDEDIHRYIMHDQPFNCAGSFKSEGLGITLFKRLIGDDPNTLIGLPLIRLCEMLRNQGISLPPEG